MNVSAEIRDPGKSSLVPTVTAYGLMIVFAVGIFLLIRHFGEGLAAPIVAKDVATGEKSASPINALFHVLFALIAVIATGQLLAKLFAFVHQPPVIGEVVAGILLGPSLIGPEWSSYVLPPSVAPSLSVIAQLGVILYMFLVGLELNSELLRHRVHAIVTTSHASIIVPFVLGAALALPMYPRFSNDNVPFTSFALFLGVAMSITAFPVLARILTDSRMTHTRLGVIAMICAAINDVTAWCLLAFVVSVAKANVGEGFTIAAWTIAYIGFMFVVIRPVANFTVRRWNTEPLSRGTVAIVFMAVLVSALATEAIGIHAIFGAFLLGAVIPHDSTVARTLTRQLEHLITILFLPAFFAFTGMRTRIDLMSGANEWLFCGLIILVATIGKFGGTTAAARLTGLGWRDASALGVLMNTRGLMELIVLNIGLDLNVISPTVFAMMVIMALATTMATSPILRWLVPHPDEQ